MITISFYSCWKYNTKKDWVFCVLRLGKAHDGYFMTLLNFGLHIQIKQTIKK